MGLKRIRPISILKKKTQPIVILTAVPEKVAAEKLAFLLVDLKLAACVNIVDHVESIYFWENKLVRDHEVKLFIKTSSIVQAAAVECIKKNHPYSVPEITVIGTKGDVSMDTDYWAWLSDYVQAAK